MASLSTNEKLQILEDLFPAYNLKDVITEHSTKSTEEIADWILHNYRKIPMKQTLERSKSFTSLSETQLTVYADDDKIFIERKSYLYQLGWYFYRSLYNFYLKFRAPKKNHLTCSVCFEGAKSQNVIACSGDNEIHFICHSCVRGMAKAVAESAPLANNGIGFHCAEYHCSNVILLAEVSHLIPRRIRKRIDERIMEENLGKSGIKVDRCRNCNFAVEMDASISVNKVFNCPKCKKNWCRFCHEEWDDEHFGRSCEEAATEKSAEARKRLMAKLMNEAVVRRCADCNFQFVKLEGCNKVICRCGVSHCYVCRQRNVSYSHFGGACKLWDKSEDIHEKEINQVKAQYARNH